MAHPPAAGRGRLEGRGAIAALEDILVRAESLARHSDSTEHYTRTYLTPAHQAAARQIAQWMREAGMEVRVDAVGSVVGRWRGADAGAPRRERPRLMLGSHFDSVRNGGKYDGVLGILLPIACVAELHRGAENLPYDIEVAAFADEEGARFQTSFLASRAMVDGASAMAPLIDRRDAQGVTLGEAMRAAGLDPGATEGARIDRTGLAAYVEVHIEQGPVLLDAQRPLGVVTSIASGTRYVARVQGEAGHAGTVPMGLRRDALAAAAEMVLAVESEAAKAGGVGTVGMLSVPDGTGNVIPGAAEFTIDLRAPDDAKRASLERSVLEHLMGIAARRRVTLEAARRHDVKAAPCASWLQERLAEGVRSAGAEPLYLPSGAGHDAMVFAGIADVGMLFVRCGAGGVSHNPAETVDAGDVRLAGLALLEFLRRFEPPEAKGQ